jgi:hypothetical protein
VKTVSGEVKTVLEEEGVKTVSIGVKAILGEEGVKTDSIGVKEVVKIVSGEESVEGDTGDEAMGRVKVFECSSF